MYAVTSSLPGLTIQYVAMGDVALSLINITPMRDARSKAQVINEAETPSH
jgi:hypothetical protein